MVIPYQWDEQCGTRTRVVRTGGVFRSMKMVEESEEFQVLRGRLLEELAELEQIQRQLDLRDRAAVDACHRKLEALRRQIARLDARTKRE
jgi:hypothetical protein